MSDLAQFIAATATEFGIPGLAVGVFADGHEIFATHGVTGIDNPLPITPDTLFAAGSITKPVTATALMRLVAEGRIDLNATVQQYVPEFTASTDITVGALLNHTSGLDWNLLVDTGEGDDALAEFARRLSDLPPIGKPGERSSYSQAGFNLLGRVIETVTGQSFERAVHDLVLAPVGMDNSVFQLSDVMTRRFAIGHELGADHEMSVVRPWKGNRANNPGGGLATTVADQLRWMRVHLGKSDVLPTDMLARMQEPTVQLRASSLGDAIGQCWFVRDIDGVRTIGHGGSGFGQFAELLLVPERDFAVVVMANAGPDGIACNQRIVRWVLAHYLGIDDVDPAPLPFDAAAAAELVGRYEIDAMTFDITATPSSLVLEVRIKPELRAAAGQDLPPDHAPFDVGLLPGAGDEYIVTSGAFVGQRGYFSRDEDGGVIGVDLAGRLFTRIG
ncbi:serine hydrolase domain-containing protein [Nocardia sp. NPDC058114]|uniref:serine hydrolase domain-containing protein n=1 Tax=Nocardia sp. NPDC058114 TaxID=3346346 RepID=UPI0036DE679B